MVADHRTRPGGLDPEWDEEELIRAQAVLHALYAPDEYSKGWGDFWGRHDPPPTVGLPYEREAQLCLPIPIEARKFAARYSYEGPRVCVLPAGGAGAHRSPTPAAWQLVCRALEAQLPGACFYFTGTTRSTGGRSYTRGWSSAMIEEICSGLGSAETALDIGIWNQLALIAQCDLFCSPHSGFGFLSQFVGTPWLALSCCPWREYVLNGVPFYSALPDCDSYPSQTRTESGCGARIARGERPACLEDRSLAARLGDIRRGAALLMDPSFEFTEACCVHARNLRALERRRARQ